jgi:endonuclease YncB( thermonuclease family)
MQPIRSSHWPLEYCTPRSRLWPRLLQPLKGVQLLWTVEPFGSQPMLNALRLADVDACELPQWTFTPQQKKVQAVKVPAPVPCGPLAKAWLKRTVGADVVTCTVVGYDDEAVARAYCTVRSRDLGLEMLRVGWARVDSPFPAYPQYMGYQRAAMSARYGMWATYVLDMNEWRRKAVDKTPERQPVADFNLLVERKSEISPPFADARNRPKRTDR